MIYILRVLVLMIVYCVARVVIVESRNRSVRFVKTIIGLLLFYWSVLLLRY